MLPEFTALIPAPTIVPCSASVLTANVNWLVEYGTVRLYVNVEAFHVYGVVSEIVPVISI